MSQAYGFDDFVLKPVECKHQSNHTLFESIHVHHTVPFTHQEHQT